MFRFGAYRGRSTKVPQQGDARAIGAAREECEYWRVRRSANGFSIWDEEPRRRGVGLALGGGFARGYAHLGVLKVLEENHVPITCLSGSSIGSVLAAAYASGTPLARIVKKCGAIKLRDIARW